MVNRVVDEQFLLVLFAASRISISKFSRPPHWRIDRLGFLKAASSVIYSGCQHAVGALELKGGKVLNSRARLLYVRLENNSPRRNRHRPQLEHMSEDPGR